MDNELHTIIFKIDGKEWKTVINMLNNSEKRKKFRAEFSHFLSKKLRGFGFKCNLSSKWNWVSSKMKSWSGMSGFYYIEDK